MKSDERIRLERDSEEKSIRYIALLRGINVGGNNSIKMSRLREVFEKMSFENATTYIQSGNILFDSKEIDTETLTRRIEETLSKEFQYASRVLLITGKELGNIVSHAPEGFGTSPELYRYDVMFLLPPTRSADIIHDIPINPDVDVVHSGPGAIYFRRLISKVSQSKLPKLVSLPVYKQMTVRNWNTTTKLLELLRSF